MELTLYTLRTVAYTMVEPSHLLVLVLLGVILYRKNRKISIMQKITTGESLNSPLELTLSQLVIGIVVGAIASVIINNIGIVFNENSGIEILFIASLITLFINNRFVGFAYTGAILGLISIVLEILQPYTDLNKYLNIDIISLITFIGMLYVIQGLLVIIDGERGAIPVFSNRDNKIIGGFAYNRSWPVPVAILLIVIGANTSTVGSMNINIPDWWPIFNKIDISTLLSTAILASMPMYGILGYRTVTFTKEKKKKPIYSGIKILAYGASLILIAQLGKIGLVGNLISIVYMPLVYEAMIRIESILEKRGNYLYVSDSEGISILEVSPTSSAYAVGIRRGDKILQVNNKDITLEVDVFKAIRESIFDVHIKIKKITGEIKDYDVKIKGKRIGVLLVPKMVKREEALGLDSEEINKILKEVKRK